MSDGRKDELASAATIAPSAMLPTPAMSMNRTTRGTVLPRPSGPQSSGDERFEAVRHLGAGAMARCSSCATKTSVVPSP
jgi:hypothetical protein